MQQGMPIPGRPIVSTMTPLTHLADDMRPPHPPRIAGLRVWIFTIEWILMRDLPHNSRQFRLYKCYPYHTIAETV